MHALFNFYPAIEGLLKSQARTEIEQFGLKSFVSGYTGNIHTDIDEIFDDVKEEDRDLPNGL